MAVSSQWLHANSVPAIRVARKPCAHPLPPRKQAPIRRPPRPCLSAGRNTVAPSAVRALEVAIGQPAIRELEPTQPGDVVEIFADVADLQDAVGFKPDMPIEEGLRRFVAW